MNNTPKDVEEIKAEFQMFVPEDDGSAMDWLENKLTQAHQAGRKAGIDEAVEIIERMKKPLWNADVKKHTQNVIRHNILNDTIKALQNK
jgi:hypothetical protein